MNRPIPAALTYYDTELHDLARVPLRVTDTHGPAAESFDYLSDDDTEQEDPR